MQSRLHWLRRCLSIVAVALIASFGVAQPAGAASLCFGVTATIVGTAGSDTLNGTAGDDVIYGDAGDDIVYGGGGNDRICGGAGNDSLLGEAGNDKLDGGADANDNAQFIHSTAPITANLALGTASGEGNDILLNIERLIGSNFDDTLIGNASDNVFVGLGGDDTFDGAAGVDSVKYGFGVDPVKVDLARGTASGEGNDTFHNIEAAQGTQAADTLLGDAAANSLTGRGGNDSIEGAGGDDLLGGTEGDDHLDGGDGNDTADGGDGTDICIAETTLNCELVADQVNNPATATSSSCGNPPAGLGSLFQSFTPAVPKLARVELRMRVGPAFPAAGAHTTIRVRAGSPSGAILGTATTFIPAPQLPGQQLVVGFSFPSPLVVTPGNTFVVEWVAANGTILSWMVRTDNPYSRGHMFGCTGVAVPGNDMNFVTFRL
jgi:Ca2+-binding RTX toxin-like protein